MREFKSVLLAILAVALLPAIQSCRSDSSTSSPSIIDDIDLIPVQLSKDGRWSMMNAKGEIVYEDEFKNEPSLAINGLFSVEEGDGYSVYSIGGKTPKLVGELENLKYVGAMQDGLMPVTFPEKRISLVDKNGNIKFELNPVDGVEIIACDPFFQEGMLRFKTAENKYGYINSNGEVVIKPVYDYAFNFSEGLAVVGHENDNDTSTRIIIDKKGTKVFELDSEFGLNSESSYHNGYMFAIRDDRWYRIDKKGNETKLPSKIEWIRDFNDSYIIFYSRDDSQYGLASIDGEILIRPKYSTLMFGNNDILLAKKNDDDDFFIQINADGKQIGDEIEYKDLQPIKHFGYIAKDRKTYVLLDNNFNNKSDEEFYKWGGDLSASGYGIPSDYFDRAEVAAKMVSMIDGDKKGSIALGERPSLIFDDEMPKLYEYRTSTEFDDLIQYGPRYSINVSGSFSEVIARSEYNYDSYEYEYYWNPDSRLTCIDVILNAQAEWGKHGQEELIKALKSAGYGSPVIEGYYDDDYYAAAFRKGNTIAIALSSLSGERGEIKFYDTSYGSEPSILRQIISYDGSCLPEEPPTIDIEVEAVEAVEAAEAAVAKAVEAANAAVANAASSTTEAANESVKSYR